MTLKEKVAEMEPGKISETPPGEIDVCPWEFDYLNINSKICPRDEYGGIITCAACWNREFVPKKEEKKMTLKEKVQRVSKLCRDHECDNCPVKQHSEEIGACTTNIFATVSEERLDAMLKCFDGEDCLNRQFVPKEEEIEKAKLIERLEDLCEAVPFTDCWGCKCPIEEKCPFDDDCNVENNTAEGIKNQIRTLEAYLKMKDESDKPTETTTTPSAICHPSHYNQGGIECIDAIKAATVGLNGFEGFCAGNAIKYLWRWKHKNGVEDLKKGAWFMERLIKEIENEAK